jgi:hypothetical protein
MGIITSKLAPRCSDKPSLLLYLSRAGGQFDTAPTKPHHTAQDIGFNDETPLNMMSVENDRATLEDSQMKAGLICQFPRSSSIASIDPAVGYGESYTSNSSREGAPSVEVARSARCFP